MKRKCIIWISISAILGVVNVVIGIINLGWISIFSFAVAGVCFYAMTRWVKLLNKSKAIEQAYTNIKEGKQ